MSSINGFPPRGEGEIVFIHILGEYINLSQFGYQNDSTEKPGFESLPDSMD